MVYLHCAERGAAATRDTHDVDAMLNVRAHPHILMEFTGRLREIGFAAGGETFMGHQHRWTDGERSVDVLIPNGVGQRAAKRRGVDGGTTVQSPGDIQAFRRWSGLSRWTSWCRGGRGGYGARICWAPW